MKSKWNAKEANDYIQKYKQYGKDIALRTYTARLLGSEPSLVLHGGGNTSVKTKIKDITGEEVDVLCVKGSGWNLASIEPAGHPAVKIKPLIKLKMLKKLSDEQMVNAQRINMLDSKGPNPSVETLLHAFLPHKFVDHSHSDAILAVINNHNGQKAIQEMTDGRLGIVPYVMPGFELSKLAETVYLKDTSVEGLVLLKHGLFTFGTSAKESYERMIYWVDHAEHYLKKRHKKVWSKPILNINASNHLIGSIGNIIRGSLESKQVESRLRKDETTICNQRMVVRFRTSKKIIQFVGSKEAGKLSQVGPPTPDHVIRTKQYPLYIPLTSGIDLKKEKDLCEVKKKVEVEMCRYVDRYDRYVRTNSYKKKVQVTSLDPFPRIVIMPGLGLYSLAGDVKACEVALDIYEHTIDVIEKASFIGKYQVLLESDLFDMEYWSLEQAKLGNATQLPLKRHIVWISGAASGIGLATAKAFVQMGANVFMTDINEKTLEKSAKSISSKSVYFEACDVTDQKAVKKSFDLCSKTFGGVDIVVSNAGNAPHGEMDEVCDEDLRKSFDLNFFSHQYVAQAASKIFKLQNTGGVLLFNASKSAFNQGAGFGPYATAKSAVISLMKQYAIELGKYNVRCNAINADRILTGLFGGDLLEKRAKARKLTIKEYLSGNLLKKQVYARDVAEAFVSVSMLKKTTGSVLTVDGGNPAAFPR